jgi:hypothetical protein
MYWCEPNLEGDCAHREIIIRLGWTENADLYRRDFVRLQAEDWTMETYRVDEPDTLPGWVDEAELRDRFARLLEKVKPIWEEYIAARIHAWEEYTSARDLAWEEYRASRDQGLTEYESVRDQGLTEYKAARAQALAEHNAACAWAWVKYKAARAQALAQYEATDKQAREVCNAARDRAQSEMISKLSTISGYVPAR